MSRALACAAVALGVVACSSTSDVGQSAERVDSICNETAAATLDGIPAYPFCGNSNVYSDNGIDTQSTPATGWIVTETGAGYQCAEYAIRYSRFRFGVTNFWPSISYAKQMCATHPASMSVTATPVHGDLMVFDAGSCGADATSGHVAVVDVVGATTIKVVQEHTAGAFTYNTSCASCFLHAAQNLGTNDPCETATSNGLYCGHSTKFFAGKEGDLYDCENGATKSLTVCAAGCVPGAPDACAPDKADAGSDAAGDAAQTPDTGTSTGNDAGTTTEPDAGGGTQTNGGGCSVTTASNRERSGSAWIAIALALVFARRKRLHLRG